MIREFTEADLPEVLSIEEICHLQPWSKAIYEQCIKSGCKSWVLEEEGIIKGFIMLSFQAKESHILNLMVRADSQKRGLGQALLIYALEKAKEKNVAYVYLEVRRSNAPAIHLYNKMDFVEIGVRRNYYQTPKGYEDAIVYAKDLTFLTEDVMPLKGMLPKPIKKVSIEEMNNVIIKRGGKHERD